MLHALLFLDRNPAAYWLLVSGLLSAVVGLALRAGSAGSRRTGGALGFWLLTALTLFAGRWPAVFFRPAFNEDENLFLAQAITALRDPMPWRAFDPMTSGPLTIFPLTLPAWLGFRLDYPAGRVVALLEMLIGLLALYALLRRAFGEFSARVATVPLLAFFTLTTFNDFLFYSSEQTPMCLVMAGTALGGSLGFVRPRAMPAVAALAGLVLGAAPYAKLQAGPGALAMALGSYALIFCRSDLDARKRWRAAWALSAGGLLFSLGLGVALTVTHSGRDFYISYVAMQLNFINRPTPGAWQAMWERVPDFWLLFGPAAAFSLGAALVLVWKRDRVPRVHAVLGAGLLAVLLVSLYAAFQPRRPFGHYLLLAVFPALALAGSLLGALAWRWREPAARRQRIALAAVFLLVTAGPTVFLRWKTPHLYLGHLPEYLARAPDALGMALRRELRSGETLAIWGWRADCYVATGATMGTRDTETEFSILPRPPLQDYYRQRFLGDMQRNQPALFVDGVSPAAPVFRDRERFGFEIFPGLASLVSRDYTLLSEVAGARIYRLKTSLPAAPTLSVEEPTPVAP